MTAPALRTSLVSVSVLVLASLTAGAEPRGLPQAAPVKAAAARDQKQPNPDHAPAARFADPDRARILARAFPEIDQAFREFGTDVPGLAWGVIIDGELVHTGATGVRDVETGAKVEPDTVFRIASMTKNFTAMAIMKLRDDGRLTLDAPASRYVPELKDLAYPTTDSPEITIRHLLTHSAGFPEDNPWGDRQLAESDATLSAWMRAGFPFSQAPGMGYEYSNTGFAILGQVVARVSGMPARTFIDREILAPLGIKATKWEAESVPPNQLAHGYGRPDTAWVKETPLVDGAYGVMGGLYSSVPDLARLVASYLSGYPARDGEDPGPLKRSSLREMQAPFSSYRSTALRSTLTSPLSLSSGGYAFGLGSRQTCRFANVVSHSGGLPGYGSQMLWLPEYGVGVVALANGTYAAPGRPVNEALEALARTGGLNPRIPQPGPALLKAQSAVNRLINKWSDDGLRQIAAMNLLLDRPIEKRRAEFETLRAQHGACEAQPGIEAQNALRGSWTLNCEKGQVTVRITLAPTTPPSVQHLETISILPASPALSRAVGQIVSAINRSGTLGDSPLLASLPELIPQIEAARAYGTCAESGLTRSGGDAGTMRLTCDRGRIDLRVTVDPAGQLAGVRISPAVGEVCVP